MPAILVSPEIKVLLVEDNADDAFLIERHLRSHGFAPEIRRVETAPEFMDALLNGAAPDVVLADYNLPSFSGPEALRLLKSSGLDIPFMMMSGAVSEEMAVESMRSGAQDYVTKQNLVRLVPAITRELKEAAGRRNKVAAEKALRESEARFHRLVEAMPLGLLISESSGRIVYANQAIESMIGYSSEEIGAGRITLEDFCPSLSAAHKALTEESASMAPFDAVCTTSDGLALETLIGTALLNPEAAYEDRRIAAFIADLSLQKKSEEVLRRVEKLAVAGRLAATIAHEINNPLEAITNCLYLAAGQTDLSEASRGYLKLAQDELDRVAQITVQTLRFYRGSTKPVQTNVHELVENILALLESRLRSLQIEIVRQFRATDFVLVQDGEIRQVLANLIGNAIDALAEGGRLVIRTRCTHNWRSGVQGIGITVADNGMGMDELTMGRIFEPFFSTKGITGTGLGLWVSTEIISKHSGTIRVRSRRSLGGISGGTVFRVFIPIQGNAAPKADALSDSSVTEFA